MNEMNQNNEVYINTFYKGLKPNEKVTYVKGNSRKPLQFDQWKLPTTAMESLPE